MTRDAAKKIAESAEDCIAILKLIRDDLVYKDIHDKNIDYVCEALSFWEEIEKQYKEFLNG